MKVRFRLDFIVDVPGDVLPRIDPLDVIEHGVRHASVNATEIMPGAKCSTTIATRPMPTTIATLKRFGKVTGPVATKGRKTK